MNSLSVAGQSSHAAPQISSLVKKPCNQSNGLKFCEIPYEPHPNASAKELGIFDLIQSLGVTRIDTKTYVEDRRQSCYKSSNVAEAFAEELQRKNSLYGGDLSASSKSPSLLMRRRLALQKTQDSFKLDIKGNFSANPVNPHKHSDFSFERNEDAMSIVSDSKRTQSNMSCAQLRLHNLQKSMKN